eukprot:comp21239_c0_seq1/m.28926 comp21239_c0_seq1/g.28926  ORF comp21239_c0_seq1/g.28926 comp21239_c0_seq1/m.28926 type:complete len:117 (-) comp21239_c0_seq1:12-362(-)
MHCKCSNIVAQSCPEHDQQSCHRCFPMPTTSQGVGTATHTTATTTATATVVMTMGTATVVMIMDIAMMVMTMGTVTVETTMGTVMTGQGVAAGTGTLHRQGQQPGCHGPSTGPAAP